MRERLSPGVVRIGTMKKSSIAQLPETILIEDILHSLYTTPLLPWLAEQSTPPEFDLRTPACERGYIGRWRIYSGALWLIGLHAWRNGCYTGVPDLFEGRRQVKAQWFTGPLLVEPAASEIPDGALPELRTLLVESGAVVLSSEMDRA